MEEWLIVDGYNVIGAIENGWSSFPLEDARLQLTAMLSEYQAASGRKVFLVFDAHRTPGGESRFKDQRVTVYFTKEHETADQLIERLVRKFRHPSRRIYVATSDYLEQRMVFGQGAYRISARELLEEMQSLKGRVRKKIEEQWQERHTLGHGLGEDVLKTFEKWRRKK
ncbi:hypothetical protein GCM10011571_23950 [Marinithermofilum abyssi]|uniref:NYN domain-containing protein n=1 Tax=Marinithermofilum abyssi TaxID=1571185 RepID=A0A8J2VE18_9BACL|nr:NYN domain-containing protein [Marinithermofilum abyssi]GGE21105.1 hypothetical protein GCM10011571_23950 [Marinithermofilum abyssi]